MTAHIEFYNLLTIRIYNIDTQNRRKIQTGWCATAERKRSISLNIATIKNARAFRYFFRAVVGNNFDKYQDKNQNKFLSIISQLKCIKAPHTKRKYSASIIHFPSDMEHI